jgi:hypothetical protein
MFADKEIKTLPAEKPPTFLNKVGDFLSWLATPPPLPPRDTTPSDWYAGLCVDASSFSDQLYRLQKALRPADYTPMQAETVQRANSSRDRP